MAVTILKTNYIKNILQHTLESYVIFFLDFKLLNYLLLRN